MHSVSSELRHRAIPGLQAPQMIDPRRRAGFDVPRAPRVTLDQMMMMEMA